MMEATVSPQAGWQNWLERWEAQQSGLVHIRNERFQMMLDVLDVLFNQRPFVVLDLASGPGSISRRVLDRFPLARCVAVDFDPVLLAIGRSVLGGMNGRLRFVEADLQEDDWATKLGEEQFDAVLTTTALHWLTPDGLVRVYRKLGDLVRPGGVLLNGDNMHFPPRLETIRRISDAVLARRRDTQKSPAGADTWDGWWKAVADDPALAKLHAERKRRFTWRNTDEYRPGIEVHRALLEEAGFREVDTLMQYAQNRVLIAVR